MGGIYRPVRIVSTSRVHLSSFSPCVEVLDGSARVAAEIQLENNDAADARITVTAEVSGEGAVLSAQEEFTVSRGEIQPVALEMEIPEPHLWDGVRDPFLYTMKVSISVDGECVDSLSKQFGVRSFSFDREKDSSLMEIIFHCMV